MGEIKCPHCGALNPEGSIYCGYCDSEKALDPSAKTYEQLKDENKDLVGKNTRLTGEVAKLTGENTKLTGENATLTGRNTKLIGEVAKLTGENATLAGRNTRLTGEVIKLSGENTCNAKWKKIAWYAIGVILLCVVGVAVGSGVKNKKDDALMKEVVMLPSNVKDKLSGFYMLQRNSDGGSREKLTSEIKEKDGVYGIRIVTDYGPEYHYFTVEGSNLKSETLGQGTIKYKQSVDKIILSFTSNNIVWEFVK